MKYQLRAGLAVLAVYSGIASILAQIPAAAVMSVTLDLIGRAAQGEHRQIGASTDPAAVAALAALAALAQLQQLAHSVSDAIAVVPQPAWLASTASAIDPASDASTTAPTKLSAHLTAEPSNPASAAASVELSAHPAAKPSTPNVDPPKLPAHIDPPLLH